MRGFTLIELIVAMAILSAFLFLGVPAMTNVIERHETRTAYFNLRRTFSQARNLAQDQVTPITLCPMSGENCLGNWDFPIHVFEDKNLNQTLDQDEMLYFTTSIQSDHGYWLKTKANQHYVRFNQLGHAFSSASTFLFCPHSNRDSLAKSIVVNFQGRIRSQQYLNNNGRPYASFANLSCN